MTLAGLVVAPEAPWSGWSGRVGLPPSWLVAGALALLSSWPGLASDGDLQRALLASGCVQATIRMLPPLGKTLLYEANCFGSSHKLLKIACAGGHCVVNSPRTPRDEADDD